MENFDENFKRQLMLVINMLIESSWSSDDEDDDNDDHGYIYPTIKRRKITKIENFVEITVLNYSEQTFQQHFRLNRKTAYELIDRLERSGHISSYKAGRENISPEKCFLICLWYLSNVCTFRQISDRFNVSLSAAHDALKKTINFLLTLRSEFIKWPSSTDYASISGKFQAKAGFPDIIGAIDGCHVKIVRPLGNQLDYVNRKGFHSVLIQAVATTDKIFTDVFCGEPGSIHDARLLRKSPLYQRFHNRPNMCENYALLGDSAYPSTQWLVPPFKDNGLLTDQQRSFNYRHNSTRVVIEHAFGLLKGRFRRLLNGFHNLDIQLITKCIMAACVLHNICIVKKDNTIICIPNIGRDLSNDPCTTLWSDENKRTAIFNKLYN